MIKKGAIEKLTTYNNSPFEILSIYLGEDTKQAPTGDFLLKQLHSLLHENINKNQRDIFKKDIEKIEDYLKNYIPSGRTIVFFSAGDKLWEVINLEFSMIPRLEISNSPNIMPLFQVKTRYSEYLVLLTDREKTRMFMVEQGEITEYSDFIGSFVPQKTSGQGRDEHPGDTDVNVRINENLFKKRIDLSAKAVEKFIKNKNIHFIILGGHKEMFKRVAESLPVNLRSKVVGNFVSEVDLPLNEILFKSKKVASEINEE